MGPGEVDVPANRPEQDAAPHLSEISPATRIEIRSVNWRSIVATWAARSSTTCSRLAARCTANHGPRAKGYCSARGPSTSIFARARSPARQGKRRGSISARSSRSIPSSVDRARFAPDAPRLVRARPEQSISPGMSRCRSVSGHWSPTTPGERSCESAWRSSAVWPTWHASKGVERATSALARICSICAATPPCSTWRRSS